MTDLTVDEEESRSPWKRIVAVLCVVGLIFAMVAGGFLALFMGIIASSAGAVGSDGSGCVPTSTTASDRPCVSPRDRKSRSRRSCDLAG